MLARAFARRLSTRYGLHASNSTRSHIVRLQGSSPCPPPRSAPTTAGGRTPLRLPLQVPHEASALCGPGALLPRHASTACSRPTTHPTPSPHATASTSALTPAHPQSRSFASAPHAPSCTLPATAGTLCAPLHPALPAPHAAYALCTLPATASSCSVSSAPSTRLWSAAASASSAAAVLRSGEEPSDSSSRCSCSRTCCAA